MDGTADVNHEATATDAVLIPPAATMTADRAHPSVELAAIGHRIRQLHEMVCGHGRRVEITRDGCDDVCVLISRGELEAMEAALTYFAAHADHADACRGLTQLLAEAGLVYTPKAYGDGDAVITFADDCATAACE